MPELQSVIQIIKRRGTITETDSHIARITGEKYIPKPHYYRNSENGQEYSHLAGGIGWPGERPGFVVIVAVGRKDETLYVLAEAETSSVGELLKECLRLRQIYGYRQGFGLLGFWYGENERFDTFVNDFNHNLKIRNEKTDGIYLSPPHDYQKPNALEIWLNRVQSCLTVDASGKKRLYLGNCNRLRNHIQNLPHDAAAKASIQDYPAITALGGVVHSLMMLKPWMKYVKRERTLPTRKDGYVGYALREQIQSLRDLGVEDKIFGEMDEYDGGELIGTVPE